MHSIQRGIPRYWLQGAQTHWHIYKTTFTPKVQGISQKRVLKDCEDQRTRIGHLLQDSIFCIWQQRLHPWDLKYNLLNKTCTMTIPALMLSWLVLCQLDRSSNHLEGGLSIDSFINSLIRQICLTSWLVIDVGGPTLPWVEPVLERWVLTV